MNLVEYVDASEVGLVAVAPGWRDLDAARRAFADCFYLGAGEGDRACVDERLPGDVDGVGGGLAVDYGRVALEEGGVHAFWGDANVGFVEHGC